MWSDGKPKNQSEKIRNAPVPAQKVYTFGDLRSDLENWKQGAPSAEPLRVIWWHTSSMLPHEREAGELYMKGFLEKTPWTSQEVYEASSFRCEDKGYTTCTTMNKEYNPLWYAYHTGQMPNYHKRVAGMRTDWYLTNRDRHLCAARAVRRIFLEVAESASKRHSYFNTSGLREWLEGDIKNPTIYFKEASVWQDIIYDRYPPFSLVRLPNRQGIYLATELEGWDRYRGIPIAGELERLMKVFRHYRQDDSLAKKASSILRFYHPCERIFAEEIAKCIRVAK